MKRFRMGIILLVLPMFLLCSCGSGQDDTLTSLNLTQSIVINCQYRHHPFLRTYTNPEKIDVILLYLHRITPGNQRPRPTEQALGDHCEITLHLWNGTTRSYELRNKDLLRTASGNWYDAEPEKANILYHLIQHIESDEPRVSHAL